MFGICLHPMHAAEIDNTREVAYVGKERNDYPIKLLRLALSYDKNTQFSLTPFGQDMPKMRAFSELNNVNGIDVLIGGATIEREKLALPIRFPIMKGLYGWRIALVHEDNKALFKNITHLYQLKKLSALQFHTWSDSEILAYNHINLVKGSDVEGLYQMLERKRGDYFPRSVLEIDQDLENHKHMNIVKDSYALIWYPKAVYFYVGKHQQALADSIKSGLELALKDGSFDNLFYENFGNTVQALKANKRHIFKLNNPLISAKTPLTRPELWLNLSSAEH